MFCTNCGHENPLDAKFCSSCGTRLAHSNDDATITFSALDLGDAQTEAELASALDDLDANDAMLFVRRGTNAGARYLLDSDVARAGRNGDCEIFLDDVTVSRRHAEFQRRGGEFLIKDLGSLNGTYLNGQRVEEASLTQGDEVQIGKFKIVFLTGV